MKVLFCFKSELDKGNYVNYHTHKALELVYCTEGNAVTRFGDHTYCLQKSRFSVMPSGVEHDQSNILATTTICIGISNSELENIQGTWADTDGYLGNACQRLLAELGERKIGYQMVCEGLLREIAGLAERASCEGVSIQAKDQIVSKALDIIQSHEGKISVGELAGQLYVSKDYLRHLFLEHSTLSPLRHIILTRIEKAKSLLQAQELTINQIAAESGFESVYYFSRIFKRITGYSPSNYRLHITEKDKT